MSEMEGRTRCAKCFIITTENCKVWLVDFVEGRLPKHQKLHEFIDAKSLQTKDPVIDKTFKKIKASGSSNSADVSALCKIIWHGKILQPHEEKCNGTSWSPTIGYQIDRIRLLRNDLMHISEATLDEQEYNGRLADLKEIARFFEIINGLNGRYVKEIDDLDIKVMNKQDLDDTMNRYEKVVKWVTENEMTSFAYEKDESLTMRLASKTAREYKHPLAQAAGGVFGGAVGLSLDLMRLLARQPVRK